MTRKLLIACPIALVWAAGCSNGGYTPQPTKDVPPATVAAGQEQTLWPLEQGNQWVFDADITDSAGQSQKEFTFKVTASRKEGDRTIATIEITDSGKHLDSSEWAVDKGGIYQLTSNDDKINYDPPQQLAKFPVTAGETFAQTLKGPAPGTGNNIVQQSISTTCRGNERIDTDQGPMEAVAYESTTTYTYNGIDFSSHATLWFVPKVGLARFAQQTQAKNYATGEIFRLKSHTAK